MRTSCLRQCPPARVRAPMPGRSHAQLLHDANARALFIYPTNPLANDQEASLGALIARLPEGARPRKPERLQGGMGAEKDRIQRAEPQIVLTNPEMVHLHLLPRHRQWGR